MNYPFILDTQSKSEILLLDCRDKMKQEIDKELINNWLSSQAIHENAYLYLEVRRQNLIEDTLNALVSEGLNFRKPLKVKFVHEPGVDEGGVQKEFF